MNKAANSEIDEIVKEINAAQSISVISHYNPDPDAYGSSCALFLALKSYGKKVSCSNETKFSARYNFIPAASSVLNIPEVADLAIICDCGTLARTGDTFKEQILKYPKIINIDHHISNDYFGHLNYVIDTASSTSEIVYALINKLKIKITPEIATALFSGITGDTGSFRYASSSPATFRVAADLIEKGADLDLISSEFWGKKSLAAVKLQAELLRGMKLHAGSRICEVIATQEIYNLTGSTPEDSEDMVERARDIEGVQVSVFIKWDTDHSGAGIWKISMRSKDKKYNVSDLAAQFGGGGHVCAAAFRWKNTLEELRALLIPKLEEMFA